MSFYTRPSFVRSLAGPAAAFALALAAPSSFAATATSLSSFEGREEPTVLYYPLTNTFVPDTYPNMTDQGGGVVRFELRYRSNEWWDGDRSTTNRDRQRAEVKGLGPHQKPNETFEYGTTWRTNPTFRGSGSFCHFFQLKATDGDDGAPLIVASIFSGQSNAAVRYWPGTADTFIVARNFNWAPDTWQNLKIRVTTSVAGAATGEVLASVDGDAMAGASAVQVYRPDSTDYRPKWGLYRGVSNGQSVGDDYVEHKEANANQVSTTPPPPGLRFEAELVPRTSVGATTASQNDARNSGGRWMALLADGPDDYVEYTLTGIPAGTYDLSMKYKSHPSRGILNMTLDGAPIGPEALDQYSNPPAYPEIALGTVRFAGPGDHVIRQTTLGKNPSSGAFTLSADLFTLLPDTTPPVIQVPDDLEVEATGPGGAVATFTATAVDDKDGDVPVTLTPPSSSLFPLGTTTVAATALDFAGNKATDSFTVTVVDTTAPVLTLPASFAVEATSPAGAVATFAASASDVVDGAVPVTFSIASGSVFPLGATTVVVTAVDGAGNAAAGSFTVAVVDTTPPVLIAPPDVTITSCAVPDIGTATASDAASTPVITNDAPALFALGTTVVTWRAVDPSGNTSIATQRVTADLGDDASCCPAGTHVVVGTNGTDVLQGTAGRDCILGRGGNDVVNALGGDDFISGGAGHDTIAAGLGNDRVNGGPGDDIIDASVGNDHVSGGPGRDTIAAGPGSDVVDGGPETDVCSIPPDGDDVVTGCP
jgi:Ca2+-binding RTX toxin-like protein